MKLPSFLKLPKLSEDLKWKLFIAFIVPFVINQCRTNDKIEEAQQQAKTAVDLSHLQSKKLHEVTEQNKDILGLVQDLAHKKEISKEQINKVDQLHTIQDDSARTQISRHRRTLDDLFKETFKKAKQ